MKTILILITLTLCCNAEKTIIFIAGADSHANGEHEFLAGCTLLANSLKQHDETINTKVFFEPKEWPTEKDLENSSAVIIYSDGRHKHPLLKDSRFANLLAASKKYNLNLGFMHYACDIKKEDEKYMSSFIGGFYKEGFSINPIWNCKSILNRKHETTNGVKNFNIKDEWYFNISFPKKTTSILQGIPDKKARNFKGHGKKSKPLKHIKKNVGKKETLLWIYEQGKRRGFGFTGGHYHKNWQHDDFRKLVCNTILWLSHNKVPKEGVASKTPTKEELDHLTKDNRSTAK